MGNLFSNKNVLIVLFISFIILRLFVHLPFVIESSDDGKYLEVSERLPEYTLYNGQIWLEHPPLFPILIRLFGFFQDPYFSAVMLSLIASSGIFFVLHRLFMLLTGNFSITFTVLLLYTLSVEYIIYAHMPFKECFGIFLIILSIYCYLRAIKDTRKIYILYSTFLGALTALTFDHALFLIPSFLVTYIIFSASPIGFRPVKLPWVGWALVPILITGLVFVSWTGFKTYQYSNNDYYLIGLDGAPVKTQGFTITKVLNPNYFQDNELFTPTGITFRLRDYVHRIGYMFNSVPFIIPRGLTFSTAEDLLLPHHFVFMLLVYLPLTIFAFVGILIAVKDTLKTYMVRQNIGLYFLLLLMIFFSPAIHTKSSPRYIATAFFFLFYFIGLGWTFLYCKKFKDPSVVISVCSVMLLLIMPLWIINNPHVVFLNEKVHMFHNTAAYINSNLDDEASIMAQPGYPIQLIRQTHRNVIGLPARPDNLMEFIRLYNISYVIYGDLYNNFFKFSDDSTEFIRNNPQSFKKIASIREGYDVPFPHVTLNINENSHFLNETVYIYEVIN